MEREITLEEGKIERCKFLMLLSKYKSGKQEVIFIHLFI